jgi:hypothetical protein
MEENNHEASPKTNNNTIYENINYFITLNTMDERINFEFITEQEFVKSFGYDFHQEIPQIILDYLYPKKIEVRIGVKEKFKTKEKKMINLYQIKHKNGNLIYVIRFRGTLKRVNLLRRFNLHVIIDKGHNCNLRKIRWIVKIIGIFLFNLLKN